MMKLSGPKEECQMKIGELAERAGVSIRSIMEEQKNEEVNYDNANSQ
jgi:hypothetical protein